VRDLGGKGTQPLPLGVGGKLSRHE
jgi:hypothetical protein